jgi:hypothetical protein
MKTEKKFDMVYVAPCGDKFTNPCFMCYWHGPAYDTRSCGYHCGKSTGCCAAGLMTCTHPLGCSIDGRHFVPNI